ncbi:hypothetical protein [Hungatella hathewayi]|uniref:hypothetical protein n=1 Tax=Hungatella hathewayi TaxID=154046 RepID=UPI003564EA3A
MAKHVETVIVGATYYGIGYACTHPNCLILEPSQVLGGNFHKGLRTASMDGLGEREADTGLGKLMKEYGVWTEYGFDVLKAAPVLHEFVSQTEGLRLLLNVKLLAVRRKDEGAESYDVEYSSNSGIHHVCCSRVLDTTVLRDTNLFGVRLLSKTLNLFTLCIGGDFEEKLKFVCPECMIEEGVNPGEKIVKFPAAPGDTIADAYEAVVELWRLAFTEGEEKILFMAEDFEYVCRCTDEAFSPCAWVGEDVSNPLTAFVRGMEAD